MKTVPLGSTGILVSRLSLGASSLGGVFHPVDEGDAIAAVHAALDAGINYFDVAPAYGGTRAEAVLGRALRGVPRNGYYLSTKVGKYTNPGRYGDDVFDYSRARIRSSIEESAERLGTGYFDIVHLHDIEYGGPMFIEWALTEGLDALLELKKEGRVGAVSFGVYPMDLWRRILANYPVDAALVHNHYCLNDTRLVELLPVATERGIGIINGSPFASGLLTGREPPSWHPAGPEERAVFREAEAFCSARGVSLAQLALQFSSQNPAIPTTLFSSACAESVRTNVRWHEAPADPELVAAVQEILQPVRNKEWTY